MQPLPNVVTPAWLAAHLNQPNLVIVDCRFSLAEADLGRQQYQAGHIPGAWYLDLNRDLSSPVGRHGGRHPLPDWPTFRQVLETMGVSSQTPLGPTPVVAYDDSRFAFASRLWWLLKYLGHGAVAVLDGGWSAWHQGGYPVSLELPRVETGHFVPQPQPNWIVDIDTLRRRKDEPGVRLIDSRSPERYRGEVEPIDPVAGSIPGAVNYFWQADVRDESDREGMRIVIGAWKSPAEQRDRFDPLCKDGSRNEVIVYCGSGVTACVNLLSQAVAGKPMGKLYVGGWSDWCSYL
ncbi:MAG TPA: sulfurtransferase [Leptolyngbyaceae cyanobacterium M65_K2018_010]|nr:sulfurtransferase [Leptolyngbyaceae cyanobacterium M65_K2018_010]